MTDPRITEYESFARRVLAQEEANPRLHELKEHLRAATAWVRRADSEEMAQAIAAENAAIGALFEYVQTRK